MGKYSTMRKICLVLAVLNIGTFFFTGSFVFIFDALLFLIAAGVTLYLDHRNQ